MKDKNPRSKANDKPNQTTWARQWHIIFVLVDCPEGKTLKELAAASGATVLTIYHDILALQSVLGPFRTKTRAHGEKVYSLNSKSFSFAPVLNKEEMVSLVLGGLALAPLKETPLARGFESAFQKMERTVDYRDLEYIQQLRKAFYVKNGTKVHYSDQTENIDKILRSISERRILKVVYHSPKNRGKKDYEIHPYGFIYSGGLLYLVGWSSHRNMTCTWRVDRFQKLRILMRTFELPQGFDLEKILSVGAYPFLKEDKTITAKVLFNRDIRQDVLDEDKMVVKTEKKKNGQTLAEVIVDNKTTFFRWLFQFEDHAMVVGPQSLRTEMKARISKMLLRYDRKKESEK